MQPANSDRLLRLGDVGAIFGLKKSALHARCAAGLLPRPVILGSRTARYPSGEIENIMLAIVRGAKDAELRALVQRLHAARVSVGAPVA